VVPVHRQFSERDAIAVHNALARLSGPLPLQWDLSEHELVTHPIGARRHVQAHRADRGHDSALKDSYPAGVSMPASAQTARCARSGHNREIELVK